MLVTVVAIVEVAVDVAVDVTVAVAVDVAVLVAVDVTVAEHASQSAGQLRLMASANCPTLPGAQEE